MLLAGYTNRETKQCNPRIATMAARLGVHPDTVDRHLKRLYLVGLVKPTKGQRGNNYWVAPRDQWAEILRVQNAPAETIPAGAKCTRPQVQNAPAEPAHPYMNLCSIEPQGEPAAAAARKTSGVVDDSGAAAAAAPPPHSNSSNTPPLRPTGVEQEAQLCQALADKLVECHPQPGLARRVPSEIAKIFAVAPNVVDAAERIWENHRAWMTYWATLEAGKFIPQLWRWFDSGDWERQPVIRKPAQKASLADRAIALMHERIAKGGSPWH